MSISELLTRINELVEEIGSKVVIAIDEAQGLERVNVKPGDDVLMRAINEFDGIIGWLTYFGYNYAVRGIADFDTVKKVAVEMTRNELINLLNVMRSGRYRTILKILGEGPATWSVIKSRLEAIEGRYVNDASLSSLLNNLVGMGVVEKKDDGYVFADPIYAAAARTL